MLIGLALIFVGIVFLLERLGLISMGLDKLWPVLVILVGVSMLAQRLRRRR